MWFSALEGLISSCRKSSVDEHKDRVSFSDVSLSKKNYCFFCKQFDLWFNFAMSILDVVVLFGRRI